MKRRLFLLFLCVWEALWVQAQQTLNLSTGRIRNAIEPTLPTRNIQELDNGLLVTYNFTKASLLPDPLFTGTQFWKIDGFGLNENPGEPSTLARNDWIAIPAGCRAKIEVTDSAFRDFNSEMTPARQPLLNSGNEAYTKQNVSPIKPYNGFKPTTLVSLSDMQTYRGYGLCLASVAPIQYNHTTRTVRAYTSITYKVTFEPDLRVKATQNRHPAHLSYEDHFLANNAIGGRKVQPRRTVAEQTAVSDTRDYLILSTTAYEAAANRFAAWKRLLGFNVRVILRDDWTSATVVDAVNNAYYELPALYYLLIIGDHGDVPAKQETLMWNHVTDFYYGNPDNDLLPEVYRGRLSVSSLAEANLVVDKIIAYERNPPSDTSFYTNGLHCAYFQDDNNNGYADRRFAQTSEDIRDYVMGQGKTLQRVYTTKPQVTPRYWNDGSYSYGEPIPDELKKPGFAWNGNSTDISNAINSGVFYVLHRDHGTEQKWEDPYFSQQHVNALTNGNLLPVVFSINCLTGKFNTNCFAETFLRKPNGGCVAIFASSGVSYSGYNDAMATGMFDAIWPNPGLSIQIPKKNYNFSPTPDPTYTLGQILGQGLVRMTETYITGNIIKYTHELFHCFGDPSMRIYTARPTPFTNVSIQRGSNSLTVNLGTGETGRITTYDPISGEVQSYIGHAVTIATSNPDEAVVCISAHNRIPFVESPDVMYIQNTHITGTIDENHDVIKVGKHVTSSMPTGDVTTSNADITLRAKKVVLDRGTRISIGTKLRTVNPSY